MPSEPSSIILYDLAAGDPKRQPWSPMTFKVRVALNMKGLAYSTEWVELPDIGALYEKLDAPPSPKDATGGRGPHTLPVIYDPSTKSVVTDSAVIIKYLDTTYPDTPVLFPEGTAGFQAAFESILWASVLAPALNIVIGRVCLLLNPRSAEHYRRTREEAFGEKLEDIGDGSDWDALEKGLQDIKEYMGANGEERRLLITGSAVTYSDVYIASIFRWFKMVVGEESEDWKRLCALHDGHWERFLAQFVPYGFNM